MMAVSPSRPQFFCSRPNGALTPMIALDELPAHVSVRGVPRALSPNETHGMTSLGTINPRAQAYVIDGVTAGGTAPLPAPVRDSSAVTNHQNRLAPHQPSSTLGAELHNLLMRIVSDANLPAGHQRMAVQSLIQYAQNLAVQNPVAPRSAPSHGGRVGNGREV